ncbi:hypothetical protein X875_20220 [Mannheimia varigena USDA-ARS-USMARC-1388]|nr:hypothetical protein X875_20220 [Mannheimia varigena USDA-ARS-USMARC-1388]
MIKNCGLQAVEFCKFFTKSHRLWVKFLLHPAQGYEYQ